MATSPIYNWPEPDNTDLVKNGALAIRTLGNAIDTTMATMTPKSIVDAKGDLIAATANDTPARLAVGANGETLVADSSATTGLRWQGDYAAGKNKIINGDFRVNQRAFSSTTSTDVYTFDRWRTSCSGGQTYTAQVFTPGAAPVAGYEGANFLQIASTAGGANFAQIAQYIEDVRTFANQTITFSFFAKAASGTPKVYVLGTQNFGSGGSGSVDITPVESVKTITASWARYTYTFNVPSITGKTIGTSSFLQFTMSVNNVYSVVGQQTNTFQIWGVQAEAGNVATAFQTATGTIQGELAACQRYFIAYNANQAFSSFGYGFAPTTYSAVIGIPLLENMRTVPTFTPSAAANFSLSDGVTATACTSLALESNVSRLGFAGINAGVTSGLTQFRPYRLENNNTISSSLFFSAEL
jgi:hypothetical protein